VVAAVAACEQLQQQHWQQQQLTEHQQQLVLAVLLLGHAGAPAVLQWFPLAGSCCSLSQQQLAAAAWGVAVLQ
jgi:hypothetical protein